MQILTLMHYYHHSWICGSLKVINLPLWLDLPKPTNNAPHALLNWTVKSEMNWVKTISAIHSADLSLRSNLCQSWVSVSRKRKGLPSVRPQSGAWRIRWHITTQEINKNPRNEQEEETEAISGWWVMGLPPIFLFLQIFFKPWQLSTSRLGNSCKEPHLLLLWEQRFVCWRLKLSPFQLHLSSC